MLIASPKSRSDKWDDDATATFKSAPQYIGEFADQCDAHRVVDLKNDQNVDRHFLGLFVYVCMLADLISLAEAHISQ